MSGGVDSSVSAGMLLEQGYEVIGITMQLWPRPALSATKNGYEARKGGAGENNGDKPVCCGVREIETARKVSYQLGITHYVVDFRDIFRDKVIKNFCLEYSQGRTPNPCIRCNQYIKFDVLSKKAQALGAEYISTGHYARIYYDAGKKRYLLKKGMSEKNEQSYFLYTMTQEQLAHTIFPLGEFTKDEVRSYARKKSLVNSEKEKSLEICFTGTKDYRDFLMDYIKDDIKPGPIVNADGEVLGTHKGLPFYTIGQREGLGISASHPLYVIKIEKEKNTLVVGAGDSVYNSGCEVGEVNLISYEALEEPIKVKVKVRYKHGPYDAEIIPISKNRCRIVFDKPQRAITPGQAAVFYDGDVVVGGGTIDKVTRNQ